MNKIIGVGFQKTGTRSLWTALGLLKFTIMQAMDVPEYDKNHTWTKENIMKAIRENYSHYDGYVNHPYTIVFKELDIEFPGSKFIYTPRNPDDWIISILRHFGGNYSPLREAIYGAGDPQWNEQMYIDRFNKHHDEVMEYFKDRPDDLLVLKICEKEGWDKLCKFVGRKAPEGHAFPHENVGLRTPSTAEIKKIS